MASPPPQTTTTTGFASEGKKTDKRTMMRRLEPKNNQMAVADLPEAQTSTPATAQEASDILTNCRNWF
jgi:hypothetical protein